MSCHSRMANLTQFSNAELHHVGEPARMVGEMIRVAKRAIFLSDSNRFGQGSHAARLLKTALYKCNLWREARFIQTGKDVHRLRG